MKSVRVKIVDVKISPTTPVQKLFPEKKIYKYLKLICEMLYEKNYKCKNFPYQKLKPEKNINKFV